MEDFAMTDLQFLAVWAVVMVGVFSLHWYHRRKYQAERRQDQAERRHEQLVRALEALRDEVAFLRSTRQFSR